MLAELPILFAAPWNELVSVLVGLVFLVIWVINQINDARKKQAAEAGQPVDVPLEPMEAAAPQPAAQGGGQADPLRAQVEEFLRRAGQQSKPPALSRPARPTAQDEIVVLLDESQVTPQRKTLSEKIREASRPGAAPPVPSAPPKDRRPQQPRRVAKARKTVADHVAERSGAASETFQKEVADLGSRVKQADEQFDVQLHQKFDHDLGRLGDNKSAATTSPPTAPVETKSPAAQIAALLASSDGVRQAVVLNEILNRPTDRW
jgi:hypothetical protein